MYLAYTYYIVNKVTGQYYYGSRYRNISLNRTPAQDLWIYYYTSSTRIKQLIEEHGKDSFDISIIMENEDYDKCYMYEQQMINEHLNNALCLNQYCRLTNKFSTVLSDEAKEKISISKRGKTRKPFSDETIAKMRIANKQKSNKKRKPMSDEHRHALSKATKGRKKKPLSEEHKSNISSSMKARFRKTE